VRRANARQYDVLLANHPFIAPLKHDYDDVVPHIYVVRIRGQHRLDELRDRLLARNIQTGIHYFPNHRLSYYCVSEPVRLPVTDEVFPELLSLPLHPTLNSNDIAVICETLLSEAAHV